MLVIVGVELGAADLLGGSLSRWTVIEVADGGALDFLRVYELLKHDLVVLAQGNFDALFQRGAVTNLGDADAGPALAGLTKDGVAELSRRCRPALRGHSSSRSARLAAARTR